MRLHVRHVTEYRYSAPVRLGRHRLRLTPRDDAGVLLARVLDVSPHPVDQTVVSDTGGNVLTLLDFLGETDHLRIDSSFHIDIPPPPSIPRNLRPLPWPDSEIGPPPSRRVFEFASDLAAMQGQDVPSFLDELNDMLFTRFDRQIRDEGDAQSPDETLTRGVGACRDLAVLFMAAAGRKGCWRGSPVAIRPAATAQMAGVIFTPGPRCFCPAAAGVAMTPPTARMSPTGMSPSPWPSTRRAPCRSRAASGAMVSPHPFPTRSRSRRFDTARIALPCGRHQA